MVNCGVFAIAVIERALSATPVRRLPVPTSVEQRASVAVILAGEPSLHACFIRRAHRANDAWSGHMAFPGGRAECADRDAVAVARRETAEEIGLCLGTSTCLGPLAQRPIRGGEPTGDVLSPYVFYAGPKLLPLRQSEEVAAAYWIRLSALWDRHNRDIVRWQDCGAEREFPGIRHGDNVIWGLTYRVLQDFGAAIGRPL